MVGIALFLLLLFTSYRLIRYRIDRLSAILLLLEIYLLVYLVLTVVIYPPLGPAVSNSIIEAKKKHVFSREYKVPNDKIEILNQCTLNIKEVWTEYPWRFEEFPFLQSVVAESGNHEVLNYGLETFCIKTKEPLCDIVGDDSENKVFTFGRADFPQKDEKFDSTIAFQYINRCLVCSDLRFPLSDTTEIYIYPGDLYQGNLKGGVRDDGTPIPPPIDSFLIIKKK
jgi:hypothetical protein